MTKEKIITIKNIDLKVVANTILFKIPVGNTFTVTDIIMKCNSYVAGSFSVPADTSIAGLWTPNGNPSGSPILLPTDEVSVLLASKDYYGGFTPKIFLAGEEISFSVNGATDADTHIIELEIIGLLEGSNIISDGQAYTDISSVENYLNTTIPAGMISQVEEWIQAMSRYIDGYCNRVLFDDQVQTFKYDGDNSQLLHIKDCVEISSVKVNDKEVTYFSYPSNKPYASRLALEDGYFYKGRQNVAVTAIQALSSVLQPEVKQSCTVLVAGIYNARTVQGKVGTTERIDNYSVTYRDEAQQQDFATAKATLSAYKRIAL